VQDYGLSTAEVARQVGISTSGVEDFEPEFVVQVT
jgi:hypothetical protein